MDSIDKVQKKTDAFMLKELRKELRILESRKDKIGVTRVADGVGGSKASTSKKLSKAEGITDRRIAKVKSQISKRSK